MNVIRLEGCALEPLGSYLKALSVLRLVSEQADGSARGWWERGNFCLETELDEGGLAAFFLERYRPTPILSPWNGGSGFYPKDCKVGIEAIAGSTGERFADYREAIERSRKIPGVGEEKGASKAEEDKRRRDIQLACRNRLPDGCVEWLDAAVGISAANERTFAPILGTGGNEGRLDYTNNQMGYLADLLIAPDGTTPVETLLKNALFGAATAGLQPGAVGQYDPGRAGGFNQGQGVETADIATNPWNFVLTLEGAVAWAAGLYRRQGVAFRSFLCSPFTVKSTPVGYGSAAAKDQDSARAEIWAPIWDRPAKYGELRALLREGRAAVDGRPAQNGLEFAEAACMLGVDRGIAGYFLHNKTFKEGLAKEMKYNPKRPLDWKAIYSTLFKYDPNSLLHGVFLSLLEGGRVRAPRAVTGFIEAEDVKKAISGGVKNSPVDPKGELQVAEADAGEKGVYSNVPYSRIEYTADKIRAYFNIDLALIRGYGLPAEAYRLLVGLALLKIRRFLDGQLRLRTACDLRLVREVKATAPEGFVFPDEVALLSGVQTAIAECKALFAEVPVTEVITPVKVVKSKKGEGEAIGAAS